MTYRHTVLPGNRWRICSTLQNRGAAALGGWPGLEKIDRPRPSISQRDRLIAGDMIRVAAEGEAAMLLIMAAV
jgi:hypothetical protein